MALGAPELQNNPPEKQLQTQQQQELQSERNQQQHHQKPQSELQAQLSISNHNGNILINQLYNQHHQQQQERNIHATPPNSTSITLPFDLELDCKTSQAHTQAQSNFQQPPFIISTPNI